MAIRVVRNHIPLVDLVILAALVLGNLVTVRGGASGQQEFPVESSP